DLERVGLAGREIGDAVAQVRGVHHVAAGGGEHDVAGDEAAAGGGRVGYHVAHERALQADEPQSAREVFVDVVDLHAEVAARHLAVVDEVLGDLHRHVDGDREAHAHVAAGARVDRRVDAHDLAAQVHQRAARV